MADITEVIHRINYDINSDALENATKAIQAQLAELHKLARLSETYRRQMQETGKGEEAAMQRLAARADAVNKALAAGAGKMQSLAGAAGTVDAGLQNFSAGQQELSEKQKKNIHGQIDSYRQLAGAAADAYNSVLRVQAATLDKEISLREKRVEEAKKLAERGNTEALRLEEERLRKALQLREQFARRQQTVNAAITVSNAIAAVARAALEGGGFGSAATIAALVAALAAGYAAVTSLSNTGEAFADGVVDYKGRGGTREDKNWVRISAGESIITARGTQKNRELLEAINKGAEWQMPMQPVSLPVLQQPAIAGTTAYATAKDLGRLEEKLDEVVGAIESNQLKQDIFFNEQGVGIMTQKAVQRERRRWK